VAPRALWPGKISLMNPSDAPRLSSYPDRRLVIACAKRGRRGSYAVARLIGRHGYITLIEFRELVSADCPRRRDLRLGDWCGAAFEELL
jgi:hypothetical protein